MLYRDLHIGEMGKPSLADLRRFKYFLLFVLLSATLIFEYVRHVILLGHRVNDLVVSLVFYGVIVVFIVFFTFSRIERQRVMLERQRRELEESKGRIEAVLQGIGDGVSVIDRGMRILFANDFLKRRFGSDILGKRCFTVIRGRDEACPDCQVLEAFNKEKVIRVQRERVDEEGKKAFYDITASPVRNERGEVTAVVQIVKDITPMKELEDQLWRYSETMAQLVEEKTAEVRRLASITDSSVDAIISTDLQGRIVTWNRGAEMIFGYKKEEVLGRNINFLVPEDLREEAEKIRRRVIKEGFLRNYESFRLAKDGRRIPVNVTLTALKDKDGRIVGIAAVCNDLTDIKRAEEEVRRLAEITDSSMDAIIGMDLEGNITSWNRGAEEIFGYKKEEIMGKKFMLMGPKEVVEEAKRCLTTVLERGFVRNEETVRQHKDGRLIPVNLTATLLKDEYGRPIGISAVMKDLTEHKQAEEKMLKLTSAIESSADIIFITDRNGVIEYVNPAFEKITGYKKEEAIGKTPRILKSGKMAPSYAKKLWDTILSGRVFRFEVINKTKEGRLFYYDQTITPLRDSSGNITHFISTGKDITDRKEAEKRIRELSMFPEKSPNPVFKIGKNGEIMYYNPAVLNYVDEPSKVSEILPDNYRELVSKACESGKEIRVEHQHGDKHLDYIVWPVSEEAAHVYGRDVTEIKRAEHLLMRTQKLAAVGRLAAGLAHEINNPLGNISLYADMLLKKAKGRDRAKLLVIKDQAEMAARHLQQLLELSHPSDLEFERVDLIRVLKKALEALRPVISKAGIMLSHTLEGEVMVSGNSIQLRQAFSNILLNAVQAMPNGGRLYVSLIEKDDYVGVKISDTGTGIPEENLDKIFDPFYTTKGVGEGAGLGLFITHMIVTKHGGRIDVKSKLGEGSTFTVYLPWGGSNEREDIDRGR